MNTDGRFVIPMKRLLLIILVACLCIPGVFGLRSTFTDWTTDGLTGTVTGSPNLYNASTGLARIGLPANTNWEKNVVSQPTNYIAWDTWYSGAGYYLYNSAGAQLGVFHYISGAGGTPGAPTRIEIYTDVRGYTTGYVNGVYSGSLGTFTTNPAFIKFYSTEANYFSNVIIGETDHHVISTFFDNWTLTQDLINPSTTGVYSYRPSTGEYDTIRNSNYFYILADTDSQDGITSEQVIILNNEGEVVNTTTIDSNIPTHLIEYDIRTFFTEAADHYGVFSVHFNNSAVYDYFSVIGNGALVSFDSSTYTLFDTATVTYLITPTYWDTAAYDYTMEFVSVTTGETLQTSILSTSSGSKQYTFTEDTPIGGIYGVIIATPKGQDNKVWMNYAYAEYHQYSTFEGYVNDETGTVISGANVTITQGDLSSITITDSNGNYTTRGTSFEAGSAIIVNATATGHLQHYALFVPATEKTVRMNITLPAIVPPAYYGLGIGGVVRDGIWDGSSITNGYGLPVPGATIMVVNVSTGESYNTTTNIAGWYLCDNAALCYLVNGRTYAVNGSKTNYAPSPVYNVTAAGTL